jgi:predicted aspartyl protease
MHRAFIVAPLLGVLASACLVRQARHDATPTSSRAELRFEERDGRRFPLALVHVDVRGRPISMIVDTGATDHVLARWVARAQAVHSVPSAPFTGGAGGAVPAERATDLAMRVEGFAKTIDSPVFVLDLPPVFEQLGIGGILSPQRLAAAGQAVSIDFEEGALTVGPSEALRAWLGRQGTPLPLGSNSECWDRSRPDVGWKYVLPILIEGHPTRLVLDTGASTTGLNRTSQAGRAVANRAQHDGGVSYTIEGGAPVTTARAVAFSAGQVRGHLEVDLTDSIAPPQCPTREGNLGMDFLRQCAMVLDGAEAMVRCRLPQPPSRVVEP